MATYPEPFALTVRRDLEKSCFGTRTEGDPLGSSSSLAKGAALYESSLPLYWYWLYHNYTLSNQLRHARSATAYTAPTKTSPPQSYHHHKGHDPIREESAHKDRVLSPVFSRQSRSFDSAEVFAMMRKEKRIDPTKLPAPVRARPSSLAGAGGDDVQYSPDSTTTGTLDFESVYFSSRISEYMYEGVPNCRPRTTNEIRQKPTAMHSTMAGLRWKESMERDHLYPEPSAHGSAVLGVSGTSLRSKVCRSGNGSSSPAILPSPWASVIRYVPTAGPKGRSPVFKDRSSHPKLHPYSRTLNGYCDRKSGKPSSSSLIATEPNEWWKNKNGVSISTKATMESCLGLTLPKILTNGVRGSASFASSEPPGSSLRSGYSRGRREFPDTKYSRSLNPSPESAFLALERGEGGSLPHPWTGSTESLEARTDSSSKPLDLSFKLRHHGTCNARTELKQSVSCGQLLNHTKISRPVTTNTGAQGRKMDGQQSTGSLQSATLATDTKTTHFARPSVLKDYSRYVSQNGQSNISSHGQNRPSVLKNMKSAFYPSNLLKIKKIRYFTCMTCKKTFDRPSLLVRHIRVHTGEKPFACNYCGKCFSTTSSLNTHRRIHTGEKPHTCNVCGKRFTASSNLYYHKMTHIKEKPHKCRYCDRSFATPGDLKSHAYTHTGNWPLKCKYCHKGFSKLSNLRNHLILHNDTTSYLDSK